MKIKFESEYQDAKEVVVRVVGPGEYLVIFKLKDGKYKDNIVAYIEPENIHIICSHEITDREDMFNILEFLRYDIATKLNYYYSRSIGSWFTKWLACNTLYDLHIRRLRTHSIDLYEDESDIILMLYKMISKFYKR